MLARAILLASAVSLAGCGGGGDGGDSSTPTPVPVDQLVTTTVAGYPDAAVDIYNTAGAKGLAGASNRGTFVPSARCRNLLPSQAGVLSTTIVIAQRVHAY